MIELVVGIVLGVGFVVAGVLGAREQRRRQDTLAVMCATHGWTFVGEQNALLADLAPRFAIFEQDEGRRRIRNVVEVPGPVPLSVFDYGRIADDDEHGVEVRQRLVVATLPGRLATFEVAWPPVEGPASVGEPFVVTGDARTARAVIRPALAARLVAAGVERIATNRRTMLVDFGAGVWTPPDDHRRGVTAVIDLVGQIPAHLWQKDGTDPTPHPSHDSAADDGAPATE